MNKIINILALLLFLPLLCLGQTENDVFSLVEKASVSRNEHDICTAFNTIANGRIFAEQPTNIQTTAAALNENEIVIEFFELPKSSGGSNYLAFVLKHGMDAPRLYHICSSDGLLSLLDSDCNFYNDTKVLTAITTPLAEELKGVTTIYFVPDGKLHEIALEYCKDTNGKMFCENYEVYRLTSSCEVVQRRTCNRIMQKVTIWGGADYNEDNPRITSPLFVGEPRKSNLGMDSYRASKVIYEDLSHKGIECDFHYRSNATEEAFKNISGKGFDALVIETHGLLTRHENITSIRNASDPLMNQALAFAYASYVLEGGICPNGIEDGLVTAKEISELDFHTIDLAIVSACKSGLGDIKWNGVHGLIRGFKLAGVHSMMVTLDNVVNHITGELWIQFFRNLTAGQSKREALLNGIKYIRAMDNGAYSHPKFWTPFILIDGIE